MSIYSIYHVLVHGKERWKGGTAFAQHPVNAAQSDDDAQTLAEKQKDEVLVTFREKTTQIQWSPTQSQETELLKTTKNVLKKKSPLYQQSSFSSTDGRTVAAPGDTVTQSVGLRGCSPATPHSRGWMRRSEQ